MKTKKDKDKLKKLKREYRESVRKEKKLKKKRFQRSKLIAEADRIFSIYIRGRDAWKPCCTCGAKWEENFQCGHFVSRRHILTRWTDRNAHSQCPKCNLWGSGEQYLHSLHVDKLYWPWQSAYLQAQAFTAHKTSDDDILDIINHYYRKCFAEGIDYTPKKYFIQQSEENI